jgi:hypothetical protein
MAGGYKPSQEPTYPSKPSNHTNPFTHYPTTLAKSTDGSSPRLFFIARKDASAVTKAFSFVKDLWKFKTSLMNTQTAQLIELDHHLYKDLNVADDFVEDRLQYARTKDDNAAEAKMDATYTHRVLQHVCYKYFLSNRARKHKTQTPQKLVAISLNCFTELVANIKARRSVRPAAAAKANGTLKMSEPPSLASKFLFSLFRFGQGTQSFSDNLILQSFTNPSLFAGLAAAMHAIEAAIKSMPIVPIRCPTIEGFSTFRANFNEARDTALSCSRAASDLCSRAQAELAYGFGDVCHFTHVCTASATNALRFIVGRVIRTII